MLVINGVTAIWKASVKIMDNNTAHTKKISFVPKRNFQVSLCSQGLSKQTNSLLTLTLPTEGLSGRHI